ncbi:dihydrolipoyl dehydrogenase [Bacillus paralicheniformis]|uniref:dihydrolipoyl dehydrogenase n=1 Tax=Bacillus paralicheniformis TaxID=1648923 RepID=UPI0022440461|nr:dihydrolipoyl dehydrogenase [Bacillus paralicheniformis]MEC1023659.1 dihydrolipoyl dehydrogenase [Bacillus paralicheniformis]MEC1025438.1 dihydrolipoyl dehydrogenase [Bacillus paralicheniformis]MEC1036793.1 dihydrolipoyl dehydrogenase [Bacillus paralicheniformis]MEC1052198.1 dihydrolipoyl dehydrogenase [Bacillus paralicheniformis]MEC1060879.1 dihydrolipoyl dehydrogenase [Bacillus paralicheniformis]
MTLAIIGGGPAGYVAAITAAKNSREVILIEDGPLGGTCLNEGCIPTKALLESAAMFEKVKSAGAFGIGLSGESPTVQWEAVQSRKREIIQRLAGGIKYLMNKNKIKVLQGKASFLSEHDILVEKDGKQEVINAGHVIIAAGAEPAALPFASFDGNWIIHSGDAMSLPSIPETIFIIGGGIIGCEFASIYSRLGANVIIAEQAEQILPEEDPDIAAFLHTRLEESGVRVFTSVQVERLDPARQRVFLKNGDDSFNIQADRCLVAVGRKPRTADLKLEHIGVQYDRKGIQVNQHMQTNIPHIYACGDITGGVQLAHAAFHEGIVAASHASGKDMKVNSEIIPRCIYTSPEIASVGLNEKKARERYGDVRIGEFPFSSNGKALILNEAAGKVKIIIEPEYQEIVGVSIVGPGATELIGQAAVMMHAELTADTMEHFIAAHPTLSETIHEALLQATGQAVHC